MSSGLRTRAQRGIINSLPYKGRIIDIDSKYLSDSDQNKVVQVLYGRDVLSTSMMFPPWNISRKKSSSGGKGSSKGAGGGTTNFYASIAFAICVGELTAIYNIYESDNLISTYENTGEPLNSLPKNFETDYGDLRIYRGTPTQIVDPSLQEVVVFKSGTNNLYETYPTPDNKNICYAVSDKWLLGSSTSHPNIRVECFKACTKMTGASGYMSNGDYAPPVILYELLKDYPAITRMFSDNNNSPLSIDTASFVSAAESCKNAGIYISVTLDESTSLADAVANILEYCDGVIYVENDTLKIRLPWKEAEDRNYREHKTFTKNDLIEEPEVSYQSDDWGITKLSFCDRSLDYEETTANLEHPGFDGITGLDTKIEEFDRPFIKQRSVATTITKYLANVGVKPSVDLTITVLPESVSLVTIDNNTNRDLRVGDLIKVDYDETKYPGLENVLFRVNSIAIAEDGAEIQAVSECQSFFEFLDTDIFYIEQSRYFPLDRGFPYLFPRILPLRNGWYNNGTLGVDTEFLLFVSQNPLTANASFRWEKLGDDTQYLKLPSEASYQITGNIQSFRKDYKNTEPIWLLNVDLSVDELKNLSSEIDYNSNLDIQTPYFVICCAFSEGNCLHTPIFFQIDTISPLTGEIVCKKPDYKDAKVYENFFPNNPASISKVFYIVSLNEINNNCKASARFRSRNRLCAVIYTDEGYESTPGYAAVFYKDADDTGLPNPAVVMRRNSETLLVSEHSECWSEYVDLSVESSSETYPKVVYDGTGYYIQPTEVELSSDEKKYLPLFEYVDNPLSNGRNYQELVTTETNGSLSFNHSFGYDSLIYVTVMHSGNTLTLPSLEGVAPGDSITIIVNAVGVEDWTTLAITAQGSDILLSRANNNTTPIEGTTFNVATGITTRLYCVLKNANLKCWYVDTVSGTDIGFI